MIQLALDLFGELGQDQVTPDRSPTWDDVQKGHAHVVYRYERCDNCEGAVMKFFDGVKCTHTKANGYAQPKRQFDGTCRCSYIVWGGEPFATVELPHHEQYPAYVCKCSGFPRMWVAGTIANPTNWNVRCDSCKRHTKGHITPERAIEEWNEGRLNEQ